MIFKFGHFLRDVTILNNVLLVLQGTMTLSITTFGIKKLSMATLSITTFGIKTLTITTLSIMIFGIMTFSITTLSIMTFSIMIES